MTRTKRNTISVQLEIKYRFESATYRIRNWWKVWREEVIEDVCMLPLVAAITWVIHTALTAGHF